MMTAMRKHYKKILIVVVVLILPPLMFFGVFTGTTKKSEDEQMYMAVIDGVPVPMALYNRAYAIMENRYRSQFGSSWNPDLARQFGLPKQAHDQVIDEVLMRNELGRLNIAVSDHAVDEALKALPDFQDEDGKFDANKWNELVNTPGIPWDEVRAQIRSQLAMQTMVNTVTKGVRVSPAEVEEAFVEKNTKVKVKYLSLTPSSLLDEINVLDAEIQTRYDETIDKYKLPDRRKLSFVQMPIEPSANDETSVREKAAAALEKVRAGEDFAALATEISEGPTAAKGGDLGEFGTGQMDPAFEKAAFALEPGEISDIVKSQFGLHIIKLEEKRKDDDGETLVRARHILFKSEASDETVDALFAKAGTLTANAKKDGATLATAGEAEGLEVQETDLFAADSRYLPVLGDTTDFIDEVFTMPVGHVSDPMKVRDAYIVYRVKEESPAHTEPLEKAKDRVAQALKLDRASDLLETRINEIAGKISSLDEFKKMEPDLAQHVRTSKLISREDFVPTVGREPAFMDVAFSAEPEVLSDPIIIGERTAVILEVVEKVPADMSELDEQRDEIRESVMEEKRSIVLEDWRKSLHDKAVIQFNEELADLWAEPADESATES